MMFKKYNFKTRGVGIISNEEISSKNKIGNYFTKCEPITTQSRFIYDGWIETNPLGRYINHNKTPNCNLVKNGDVIEIHTNKKIKKFEEITINYLSVIELISLPQSLVDRYSIIDYDYIEEDIIIKHDII